MYFIFPPHLTSASALPQYYIHVRQSYSMPKVGRFLRHGVVREALNRLSIFQNLRQQGGKFDTTTPGGQRSCYATADRKH